MVLAQKYKPRSLKEFVDQKEAVNIFLKWVGKWKPGSKALLLYGMPGTGKTALIHAYANEKNFEFVEMNASDFRSAQQIQGVFGQAMKQLSLFKKSKIFLIDEVDGIAGREDLGGIGAVIKMIKESKFPVVITANNPWSQKLRALRQHCQLVKFEKISAGDIEKRLDYICRKERIKFDGKVLRQLASKSSGDLRSAINDLDMASQGKNGITASDLEALGHRERKASIFEVLRDVFKSKTALAARQAISQSDKDPEEIFWWIENNILNEYEKPEEVAAAYDALSVADIFRQRIIRRQNWRMMAYMIDMMTGGVSVAKAKPYAKFTRYQYPSNIMILGRTKEGRTAAKEVLNKIAKQLHCSTRKTREEFLPFLKVMVKNSKFKREFLESFGIGREDVESTFKL